MNTRLITLLVVMLLFSCKNTLDSSEEEYTIQYIRLETSLDFSIADLIDKGHYLNSIIIPSSEETMGFLLIESPEHIDSIYPGISYSGSDTPHLEDLFPEDGMLLVYNGILVYGETLEEYTVSHVDSFVYIDQVVFDWDGLFDPGVWRSVYVIGVFPR